MSKKVLCLSGAGVRIYGAIGALAQGYEMGIDFTQFDIIQATSAGAIVGLMMHSGLNPLEIEQRASKLPLKTFVDAGFLNSKLLFGGISNKGLGKWADNFKLAPSDKFLINAFDKNTNTEKIFTKEDYEKHGYGYAIRCSTCYPVVFSAIDDKYQDGGICENPLMLNLDPDDEILCIHLGYAGEVKSDTFKWDLLKRAEEGIKAVEFLNHQSFNFMTDKFNNLDIIYPKIYDVASINFWITQDDMIDMVRRGRENSKPQWEAILQKWSQKTK